jgi:hypothetical protein
LIQDEPSLSVVIVAIGKKYVEYANELLNSFYSHAEESLDGIQFIVISDLSDFISPEFRGNVKLVKCENLGWPEASLLRSSFLLENRDLVKTTHILCIDADMLIVNHLQTFEFLAQDLFFVSHPGFFNRGFMRTLFKKIVHPVWENSRKSKAFVPVIRRREYVCGAVWGGTTASVLNACAEIASWIRGDIESNNVARVFDESYLNAFYSKLPRDQRTLFDPTYCFVPNYPWLKTIKKPLIFAVEKTS